MLTFHPNKKPMARWSPGFLQQAEYRRAVCRTDRSACRTMDFHSRFPRQEAKAWQWRTQQGWHILNSADSGQMGLFWSFWQKGSYAADPAQDQKGRASRRQNVPWESRRSLKIQWHKRKIYNFYCRAQPEGIQSDRNRQHPGRSSSLSREHRAFCLCRGKFFPR